MAEATQSSPASWPETPLDRLLAERITRDGPIGVDEWMRTVLLDPVHGYYATRDPLGAAGDFTTAPEISQMFGEILGLWCADLWAARAGSPDRALLVELGPGRGTLMADMRRAQAFVPGAASAFLPHLVEASPVLRQVQRQTLGRRPTPGPAPVWPRDLAAVPTDAPLFLVANELFDALPVRQWAKRRDGWRERRIGLGPEGLRFVAGPLADPPDVAPVPDHLPENAIVERSAEAVALAQEIACRIARQGGAALIVDYGFWDCPYADTLQAVKDHRPHLLLQACGSADVTAYVDFATVARTARAAADIVVWGPVEQGLFLARNGIQARAAQLRGRDPKVDEALRRLIHREEMGTLFKVMAIADRSLALPGGFEAVDRRL